MKDFALGDILSVTTGQLLSRRHMEGLYDILNFMTGDNLFTHQLPRAADEAKPFLLKQHPDLAGVDASSVTKENWESWLEVQEAKFGATLSIEQMPSGTHQYRDPITELQEMTNGKPIIVVQGEDNPDSG